MIYDAAIIGTGPAGFSAALNLKIRNKSFLWIGSRSLSDKVTRAEQILNYPGLPEVSGEELAAAFQKQIGSMGLEITEQMVNSILPFSGHYALLAGSEFFEARGIILATGTVMSSTIPGESDFLGRGVSYCATCDGGLYRGKTIAVVCNNARFEPEVSYLADLAAKVYFLPLYRDPSIVHERISLLFAKPARIVGEGRVTALRLQNGEEIAVDGIFCLRDNVAISTLLPGIEISEGHIVVDRSMATCLPGVFAAGDCTGRPYQYTKAVGEGNIAAHSLLEYLSRLKE